MERKYYIKLDILRTISCFLVLLYHLSIIKGGYLAVCTFFALSGYLEYISLSNKEVSLKKHYLNRLKKIYLPLLLVISLTIIIFKVLPNLTWLNLKPEVLSSILGYNSGEFYISNHTDDGYIESDYMRASCLACWELFTDKLICLIRNDHERVNYEFMRKCQKAMRGFYRHDAIKIRLKNGTDSHTISRDFLEKVLNTSISIPFSIDKKKLMEVLYSCGIDIVNTIKEIIDRDFTQYELCTL